jgi:prepilin-type N-terminal cleavage/methylation domain-containing protein
MKNKGFTLIELLGVIMILAILALITFPPIIEEIKKSKSEIKGTTKVLIIDAAKDYYADNMTNYEAVTGKTYCIDINTLIENNYLSKKIKDENLNDINTNKKIKMVYGNNKFEYEIVDECTDNIYDNDMLDSIIARETETIKNSITPATPDGVYYYDENGNLENNGYIINIGNDSKIRGNIMIHNNQFISGCIAIK